MANIGWTLGSVLLVLLSFHYSNAIVARTCEGSNLFIRCDDPNLVIVIGRARYGRSVPGSSYCNHPSIQTTNCGPGNRDFDTVNDACTGLNSCTVPATNYVFGDPCPNTYKYLEVEYTCRPPVCEEQSVCEGGFMTVRCPSSSQKLHICRALYGRWEPGSEICPHSKIQTTSCTSPNALAVVRHVCENRNSCVLTSSNQFFGGDPCQHTYKYLQVHYLCLPF